MVYKYELILNYKNPAPTRDGDARGPRGARGVLVLFSPFFWEVGTGIAIGNGIRRHRRSGVWPPCAMANLL